MPSSSAAFGTEIIGTPDFSTGPRSKSTTNTWNSSPQRELTTNPLSGKLGADHLAAMNNLVISVLNRAGHVSNAYARRDLGWDRTGGLRALELL